MSKSKFWMVLGSGAPTFRHPTKKSAAGEAERLAKLNPGYEFVVLESIATVKKTDIHWELNDVDNSVEDESISF